MWILHLWRSSEAVWAWFPALDDPDGAGAGPCGPQMSLSAPGTLWACGSDSVSVKPAGAALVN